MNIKSSLVVVAGTAIFTVATFAKADNPEQSFSWTQEIAKANAVAAAPAPSTGARHIAHPAQVAALRPHPFSLRRLSPDEEAWDPTYQMDPRIGRWQDYDAQN